MKILENVEFLVDEYRSLLGSAIKEEASYSSADIEKIRELLVREGAWSSGAAEHLMAVVSDYGSFMLRNALALSLVLGIEDGELGF
jgi:hypothetical protein